MTNWPVEIIDFQAVVQFLSTLIVLDSTMNVKILVLIFNPKNLIIKTNEYVSNLLR